MVYRQCTKITQMQLEGTALELKWNPYITIDPTCHYIRKFQRRCILFPVK